MRHVNRLGNVSIMIVAGLLLSGAALTSTPPSGAQEMTVVGVFVDPDSGSRVVMLEGKRDKRTLAMVIGAAEATGIAVGLHNVTPPRPLTHDLFLTLFGRLNVAVDKVVITDLREHTYYATLYLKASGAAMELDSRPSDAIALALRAKAPVFAADVVLDKAGQRPGAPAGSGQRI